MLTLAVAYLAVFASFKAVKTSLLFTFFFSEKTDFNSRFRVKCFLKKKGRKEKSLAGEPSHAFRSPSSLVSCCGAVSVLIASPEPRAS